jgi:carbamoyl-phosphate synthase large subunit
MNILITSAARKVWLVKAFQAAGAYVIACDMDKLSPALYISNDKLLQPKETDIIDFLLAYCSDHKIDAIIPTRDEELKIFSKYKNFIELTWTKVIVSDEKAILNSCNKLNFAKFCFENDFATPNCYPSKLFAKPFIGSGSKDTYTINYPNHIIQKFIDWPEYTIDVFIHPDGTPISAIPRERLKVVNGESWTSKTVNDKNLIDAAINLCSKAGLIWHSTLQCFYNGKDIKWIEAMNRFGGGSALSFAAGANSPQWIVNILQGKEVKPCIGNFKDGLTMLRFTDDIFI